MAENNELSKMKHGVINENAIQCNTNTNIFIVALTP